MQKKFEEATFDFTDFLQQLGLIKRMGSIGNIMKMIPGMNKIDDGALKEGEVQLKKFQSMIGSMTADEKKQPELLVKSAKRRRRIALGSGYVEADVDKMVNDFVRMRKLMQGISKGNISGMPDLLRGQKTSAQKLNDNSRRKEGNREPNPVDRATKKKKGFFDL
jgi:signal recognition particle subunit SRP54